MQHHLDTLRPILWVVWQVIHGLRGFDLLPGHGLAHPRLHRPPQLKLVGAVSETHQPARPNHPAELGEDTAAWIEVGERPYARAGYEAVVLEGERPRQV